MGVVLGRPEVRGGARRGEANREGACGRGVVSAWTIALAGSAGGPTLGFPLSLLPASLSSSGTNGIHYCSASEHRTPMLGSAGSSISDF